MRRVCSMGIAVVVLAMLALTGSASAAPTVKLKAKAAPIPGFPGTGNFYGAGAAAEFELTIQGNEYGGFQPPLIGVKVFLPAGVKLHPKGFPICPERFIEAKEPEKCPKNSKAGPRGKAEGFVVFGTERVPETVSIEGFYAKGGLNFVVIGHTPASIEIVSKGRYAQLNGGGGYGPEGIVEVPLIQTVPGAPDASAARIVGKLGSAIKRKGKKPLYYATLPTKCPKHHMTAKVELEFAENGNVLTPVVVPLTYNLPCPKHPKHRK
jgi:hypothetical protein